MSCYGTIVYVTTAEQYERMMTRPLSLSGWFNPVTKTGEIWYATQKDAQAERRFL